MKCNEAQSLMLDHLYGGLKPRKEKALLLHLGECSTCAKEYAAHKATASAFAKLDMEEPPPGLTAKVVAMATEDIERQKSTRAALGGLRWAPTLATAAVAVVAVVFVVRYIPQKTEIQRIASAPVVRSVEEAKDALAPPAPAEREETLGLLAKQSAVRPEMETAPSDEYRANAKVKAKAGFYDRESGRGLDRIAGMESDALDSNGLGDDIAMDNLAAGEPDTVLTQSKNRVIVGGKASVDGPRASEQQKIVSASENRRQLRSPDYIDSGSFGRSDVEGYSIRSRGDKEISAKQPASSSLSFQYSHADEKKTLKLGEGVSAVVEPEAPAPAKPQSMPAKPKRIQAPLKKEQASGAAGSVEVGSVAGSIITRGERKFDLDASQEEMVVGNGELFDGREFNEAVAEFEKGAHREPDSQFAAKARYKLGRTYQEEDDCEKALAVYETIPDERPDFDGLADVYIAMGDCYLELNRFEDAIGAFELVREKFPDKSILAARRLGEVVATQKALEKANEDAAEDSRRSAEEVEE